MRLLVGAPVGLGIIAVALVLTVLLEIHDGRRGAAVEADGTPVPAVRSSWPVRVARLLLALLVVAALAQTVLRFVQLAV